MFLSKWMIVVLVSLSGARTSQPNCCLPQTCAKKWGYCPNNDLLHTEDLSRAVVRRCFSELGAPARSQQPGAAGLRQRLGARGARWPGHDDPR